MELFTKNRHGFLKESIDVQEYIEKMENLNPYYIFNDVQMMDLIEKNPKVKRNYS